MNKNFKVVFSKARNALMVVNEVTSSVQAKGTKTVIAAAVAAVAAGAAAAAEPVTDTKLTDTDQQIVYTGKDATDGKKLDQYFVTANKDGATVTDKTADVFGKDGKVDVLMRVDEDKRLVISNGAFTNLGSPMADQTGGRGALVSVAGGNAAITNVTFEGNKFASGLKEDKKTLDGTGARGLVLLSSGGKLYVKDSAFKSNAGGFGTAIHVSSGTAEVINTDFIGNTADYHGGAMRVNGSDAVANVEGSLFQKNTAGGKGGAAIISGGGKASFDGVTFSGNEAKQAKSANGTVGSAGGALMILGDAGEVSITDSAFTGNKASTGRGGAIAIDGSKTESQTNHTITNSTFTGNTAVEGGAVGFWGGKATFTDTDFIDNTAGGWGGAIFVGNGGEVTIAADKKDVTFSGNKAGTDSKELAPQRYDYTGDALYLQGTKATFDAAKDRTITVADGIVALSTAETPAEITKSGEGALVVTGSMEGFVGNLKVAEGEMTISGGIGSYDLATQSDLNNDKLSKATTNGVTTTVTVGGENANQKAKLTMGDVVVNRAASGDDAAGTKFDVKDGSALTLKSLTLTSSKYTDRVVDTGATPATFETKGHGTVVVAEKAEAQIEEALTVEAGTTFDKDGAGKLTVGSLSTAAATTGTGAAAAGTINISAGTLAVLGASTNAGTIQDGTGSGTLEIAGDFANSGAIDVTTLDITGGTFTNTAWENVKEGVFNKIQVGMTADTLTIENAKFVNSGTFAANTIELNEGAWLETAISLGGSTDGTLSKKDGESSMVVNTLYLNEGATLNVLGYNDKYGDAKENNALNIHSGTFNLEGGNVLINGESLADKTVKINAGKLNVTYGDYEVGTLSFESDASGVITIKEGSLKVNNKLETNKAGDLVVGVNGTLDLTAESIGLKAKADGSSETAAGFNGVSNSGTIKISGFDGQTLKTDFFNGLTAGQTTKITGTGLIDFGNIAIEGVTADDDGYYDYTDVKNLGGVVTDTFKQATFVVDENENVRGSFGSLRTSQDSINVDEMLVLNGSGLLAVKTGTTETAAEFALSEGDVLRTTGNGAVIGNVTGKTADDETKTGTLCVESGSLSAAELTKAEGNNPATYAAITVSNFYVEDGAAFTSLGYVTVKAEGAISGTANIKNLKIGDDVAATLEIDGSAVVETLGGNTNSTISVGDNDDAGSLVVTTVKAGTIFADPAWENGTEHSTVAVETLEGGVVEAGRNSIVAVGTTNIAEAQAALAKTGRVLAKEGKNAVQGVAYVTGNPETDEVTGKVTYTTIAGNVLASGAESPTAAAFTGTTEGGLMIVDMNKVDATGKTALFAEAVKNDGTIYLLDGVKGQKVALTSDTSKSPYSGSGKVEIAASRILTVSDPAKTKGEVSINIVDRDTYQDAFGGLAAANAIYSLYDNASNNNGSKSARFANWLMSAESVNGLATNGDVVAVGNAAAAIGATAGLQTVTMDAVEGFTDTIGTRTSILASRGEGVNVWADVNGGRYQAKKLMDGAGYSSDIYAGVLGIDTTVSCGAVIGAAITVGTADTDSEKTLADMSTDTDFYGVSLYTSKRIGEAANFAVDLGYVHASNDVSGSVAGYRLADFSADTDAFTLGIKGELLTKFGSMNVVPHAGLRYTRLSTDDFEAAYETSVDDMNIFQMPVGVTFSGDFDLAGWKTSPMFDLSVIPAFGDKDADMKLGIQGASATDNLAVRVIDTTPVQAALGISATKGAWNFGLSYKLGVGGDERLDNAFNARVSYAF